MPNQNFIGGAWVAARSGATDEVAEPGDRRGARRGPGQRTPPTSTRRSSRGQAAFDAWSAHDAPRARSEALHKVADAIEADLDTIKRLEMENCGKPAVDDRVRDGPHRSTTGASSPAGPGSSRAAPAGEYLEEHTSLRAPRPARRGRLDRAVELPDQHGDLEARTRARGRQHRGAEAVGAHAADRAAARRDHRRHPADGRAQRRDRPGRDRRRRARAPPRRSRWCRSPAASRPASSSPAPRPRRSSACTSSSAARRRWSSSTTPTSRPRSRSSPTWRITTPARTAPRRVG